jgi:hypothetical protein
MEFFKAIDLYSSTGAQQAVEILGFIAVTLVLFLLIIMFFDNRGK